jgi:predicted metal-dependent phosphotriesterase family hydrolase
MTKVPTVRGPVDSSELGVTLIHEHICLRGPEKFIKQAMDYQAELTKKAADAGINTLVDLSPHPDVGKIIRLNEKVPEINLMNNPRRFFETG